MIKGGYYIKARAIQESKIMRQPPYVREIWDYLIMSANHADVKYGGNSIKRGQCFRSYKDIRNDLCWYVGWRKHTYNENQTKKAMKFLREALMVTTTKELGGVMITVLNYSTYQDPKNYERTNEGTNEGTIEEPLKNQPLPDNNKNVNNNKNEKNVKNKKEPEPKKKGSFSEKDFSELLMANEIEKESDLFETLIEFYKNRKEIKSQLTAVATKMLLSKLRKIANNPTEAIDILKESIMNNWKGIFPIKWGGNQQSKPTEMDLLKRNYLRAQEEERIENEKNGTD